MQRVPVIEISRRISVASVAVFAALCLGSLASVVGCATGAREFSPIPVNTAVSGVAMGGQQPISGSTIQVYAMGTTGAGSVATALLTTPVTTNQNGQFNLPTVTCPSAGSELYITSSGGNPGLAVQTNNASSVLAALLGICGNLSSSTYVSINERTTVAMLSALAPYAKSITQIGSAATDVAGLQDALTLANSLANSTNGTAPGPLLAAGQIAPTSKLTSLADILATCVNSSGGIIGDSTACGRLFTYSESADGVVPKSTADAAIEIARNPEHNVTQLFGLTSSTGPFLPTLSTAPTDWSLALTSSVSSPTMMPTAGAYSGTQAVVLSDATVGAQLFYTTDGSQPSKGSTLYTGAITVSSSETVRALAIAAGSASVPTVATYVITPPVSLLGMTVTVPQPSMSAGGSMTGTIVLSLPTAVSLSVSLTSSAVGTATVPANVIISAGQTFSTFLCTGVAAGTSTITALASGYSSPVVAVTVAATPTTLRGRAAERGILVGAAADADDFGYPNPLVLEPLYASTLSTQYNMIQPENAMKWISLHPAQNTYNFEPSDQITAFGQAHHMKVRGHNLVWGLGNPDWLNTYAQTATPAQMSQLLYSHMQTVMTHYKGEVFAWDVVNEAIDANATGMGTLMTDSIWYNHPGIGLSGTGYVEQAFRWAHAIDPDALLFYNDAAIYTPGPKFQALMNMLNDFVTRGVPINGVGLEMHVDTNGTPDATGLAAAIQQITALGLQVHITEMDVQIPVNSAGVATAANLALEAQAYQRVLGVCLTYTGCTAFQTWGFSDKHSWIPIYIPGMGAALPFDTNYVAKPAFASMMDVMLSVPVPQ